MLYLHFVLMLHRSAEVFTRPSNETLCWLDGGSCESDWEFVWFLACAHIDCLGRTWVRDVEPARFLYMSPRPRHVQDRAESLGQARPHHVPRPGHYQARSCLAPGPRPGSPRVAVKGLLQFHTKHVASGPNPNLASSLNPRFRLGSRTKHLPSGRKIHIVALGVPFPSMPQVQNVGIGPILGP